MHAYVGAVRQALRLTGEPTPRSFVDAAMGAGALRVADIARNSGTMRLDGRWFVVVRRGLAPKRAHWEMAFRFAEWALAQDKIAHPHVTPNTVAAALLLPPNATIRELREHGAVDAARRLVVPVMATVLREAELVEVPAVHVLRGAYVRIRGDARG